MSGRGLTCLGHRTYSCQLCSGAVVVVLPVKTHGLLSAKRILLMFDLVFLSAVLPLGNSEGNLLKSQSSFFVSGDQHKARRHQVAPSGWHQSPAGLF